MSTTVLEREGFFLGTIYGGRRGTFLRLAARCELTPDEADGVAEMLRTWAREVRRKAAGAAADAGTGSRGSGS